VKWAREDDVQTRRTTVLTWAGLLVLVHLLVVAPSAAAVATELTPASEVAPRDIALTLEDLPAGFVVDTAHTRDAYLANAGPETQVQFLRTNAVPENQPQFARLAVFGSAEAVPVVVGQTIIRLDGRIGAGDALELTRARLTGPAGFAPTADGPNDGGTYTLRKVDGRVDGTIVGFIKENMIIVTLAAGFPGEVTYQSVLQLAGISSGRLDAKLGR
jgi:hypothetical protein